MQDVKLKILLFFIAIATLGCSDRKEDVTNTVNKNGSVETSVHIEHLGREQDEITTTHKIWVKNSVYKTVEYKDTIPSLGTVNTEAENEDGDAKIVSVPKEYEIFITVK